MLDKTLAPHAGRAYILLRVVVGFLFAVHGAQKVFGFLTDAAIDLSDKPQLWIGGVIELVTGALMAVGLFTRWAAFLASGTMAVAYAQFHWKFQFDEMIWPTKNNGELALVYAFLFLYIACRGSGYGGGKKKSD
ncbi:unnamed protein product [Symbiodinium sp. KB8]|nr:unnamed protein product [Symbiodinium sp. KB8]